jgi:Delta3-Delta2-enoyl-CoA isomerase
MTTPSTMKLEQQGSVFVLTLTNGAAGNVLNDAVLNEFNEVINQIKAHKGDAALVITSDDAKTFSNGIDLPWLMQQPDLFAFITRMENMMVRLSLLNLPVIAAINGNAYAGVPTRAAFATRKSRSRWRSRQRCWTSCACCPTWRPVSSWP